MAIKIKKIFFVILIILCVITSASCSKNENTVKTVPKKSETESATSISLKTLEGIDVSSFNGKIDWKAVKNDKIKFAMIRIGGRGYGENGAIYQDKYALYNLKHAQKENIKTGVYFFSQATSDAEAKEEAKFVTKMLGNIEISLPIAYDVEKIKNDTSRIDNVSYKESVRYAKVFMKTIKKLGYEPMVYIGEDSILKAKDFKEFDIWYADYSGNADNKYHMLQYSKTGKVSGIDGNVDLDRIITNQ